MSYRNSRSGFTLVEVTLAMAFLSVLLITITFLTVHITSIYQKGLSIKAVTTTGRELIDDFSRSISSASTFDVADFCLRYHKNGDNTQEEKCIEDQARKSIYQVRYAEVTDNSETNPFRFAFNRSNTDQVPVSGVFCTGRYSYLWNSGYVLNDNMPDAKGYSAILVRGEGDDQTTYENFRLLKVVDLSRSLCVNFMNSERYEYSNSSASTASDNRTYASANLGTVEEVLTSSEDNLALYSLDIFEPTVHEYTGHAFYSGTFILATVQGGIDITAAGDYCSEDPSMDLNTDFNYCAINKFNFAMRATGENKS